jgi:hypothetical protein
MVKDGRSINPICSTILIHVRRKGHVKYVFYVAYLQESGDFSSDPTQNHGLLVFNMSLAYPMIQCSI